MEAVASVITIAGLAYTFKNVVHDIRERDEEVERLERKVDELIAVIEKVKALYRSPEGGPSSLLLDESEDAGIQTLVKNTANACGEDLKRFDEELRELTDIKKPVVKFWKQRQAAPKFARLEKQIEGHQLSLQLLLNIQHDHNLSKTREVMAQGFAAVLDSNIKMFAELQKLARSPQPIARRESETTLVDSNEEVESEEQGQPSLVFEDDKPLREILTGLFAFWTKDSVALGGGTNPGLASGHQSSVPQLQVPQTCGGPVGGFGRLRTPSPPAAGLTDKDAGLTPMTSTASTVSRDSPLSNDSLMSVQTRGTSISANSYDPQNREMGLELVAKVQEGCMEDIEALVCKQASLEEIDDRYGRTPLLLAIDQGNKAVTELLLQNGANIRAQDNQQNTAIHLAIRRPSIHNVIASLIDADKKFRSGQGQAYESLINVGDKNKRTPLHACAKFASPADIEVARELLKERPHINARDSLDNPPAYFAINSRKVEMVDLLLEDEHNVDFKSFSWPEEHKITNDILSRLESRGYTRPDIKSEGPRKSFASRRSSGGRSSPLATRKTRQSSLKS